MLFCNTSNSSPITIDSTVLWTACHKISVTWHTNEEYVYKLPAFVVKTRCNNSHCVIIIIIFSRPLAQSRSLKIKQLRLDMALTQIWMCS